MMLIVILLLIFISLIIYFIYQNNNIFSENNAPMSNPNSCVISGCSGQICSNEPQVSTCEYKCEYGCYKNANCRNINGVCKWETGDKFRHCLNDCKI